MNLFGKAAKFHISSDPFHYVVIEDAFEPVLAESLSLLFRELIVDAKGIGKVGEVGELIYDAQNYTPKLDHLRHTSMSVFTSTRLRRFIAELFSIRLDENMIIGMHRHNPGSRPGWAHTDFAIVSFPNEPPNVDGNRLFYDGCGCNYSDDSRDRQPGSLKTARAIACLYYTANPNWSPGMEGETGIYSDLGKRLIHRIPPLNNSLLIFEISPISYHAFMGASKIQRNCYIWWYHAEPKYLLERHREAAALKVSLKMDPWDRWTGQDVAKFEP